MANEQVLNGRWVDDFSGFGWKMERMRIGQGVAEEIHLLINEHSGNDYSWNYAKVPGDVYTDLYVVGELEDPYFGRNMAKCKWVQDYEWWYTYDFALDPAMEGSDFTLILEGVDYSCDVWLNAHHLGHHEGMMSSFQFDVSEYVDFTQAQTNMNKLFIKLDPPPKNQKNFAGMKHNFAGDYLTGVIPFGIWKPVKLIATNKVRIENYRLETIVDGTNANLSIEANITGLTVAMNDVTLAVTLSDGANEYVCTQEVTVKKGANTFNLDTVIEDAKLWWPYELGDPFLYDIKVEVLSGDVLLDNIEDRVGLRQVTMAMNPGFTLEEVENPWTFVINGKPMFLRSACWGGQPSFFYGKNNTGKYQHFLEKAKECNINNLRIFGWHPAETEDFYRICDELGITVWTNFGFATQVFRDDTEYLEKLYPEIIGTVVDRRNHASTIMWMGGEEVYFSEPHVNSANKNLMIKIGELTKSLTNVPYADASPLSTSYGVRLGYKPKESSHANGHYYAGGARYMEDFYPSLDYAVIPELTAASAPNVESLRKFIPEDELWPMGLSWGYHWADIHVLQNLNIEVFGDDCMDSLEHFVEATQIAQGTILQFALEHFRRCKPHISAVSLCHFITNWPLIKWEIIDYYGVEKKSFNYVKKCYAPLIPSLKFPKRRYLPGENFNASLWVINDYYREYSDVTYTVEIVNKAGESQYQDTFKVDITENSATQHKDIDWEVTGVVGETFTVKIAIATSEGEELASNEYVLLLDDQEKSKEKIWAAYQKSNKVRREYGRSYFRYTPEIIDSKYI
ncbi:MAG: glycoside hydrolase family 2 [Lachnospiraceae bacterium]